MSARGHHCTEPDDCGICAPKMWPDERPTSADEQDRAADIYFDRLERLGD